MGVFDPDAEVRTGEFKPCREHLRIVNAEVKQCKSGRDSINFEFKTDAGKTRYKTVTVNSIFSSVIKGMMLGVGIDPVNFGDAELRDIARAFINTEGEAWTSIPKDKEYPEPQYFFQKTQPFGSGQKPARQEALQNQPGGFPDDIPF